MSDGFSAFRAMAVGVGLLLAVTSVAPSVISGHFDGLRLSKGKGKSTASMGLMLRALGFTAKTVRFEIQHTPHTRSARRVR